MLPRPPKLQLSSLPFRKQSTPPAGLDTARRWLHITNEYLVLEIEGESEGLLLSRELDSTASGGVRMRTAPLAGLPLTAGSPGHISSTAVDGLFGFYELPSGPHLACITKSRLRIADQAHSIEYRQVARVLLTPLLRAPAHLTEREEREEERVIDLLRLAFSAHQLYFSAVHDVTHSLQRRAEMSAAAASAVDSSSNSTAVDWRQSDERFFWNREVLQPLISYVDSCSSSSSSSSDSSSKHEHEQSAAVATVAEKWIVPVMSAFFQLEEGCSHGGRK
jgi:SacI homology domain